MNGSRFAGAEGGADAPMPRTAVVVARDGGQVSISLRGDLDRIPADHIIGAIVGAGKGARCVPVDLAGVAAMTRIGLRTLVRAAEALEELGTTIELVHATGDVRRIVEVAGLVDLLGPAA
jgi:anti-anti-sigma factor